MLMCTSHVACNAHVVVAVSCASCAWLPHGMSYDMSDAMPHVMAGVWYI